MVLIASYSVNAYGLNLHSKCRNIRLIDPAMSESIRQQAIGRVLRFGQESIVLVYEYFTDKLQYPAGRV